MKNEIEESAFGYHERYRIEQDIVVGVNKFVEDTPEVPDILRVDPESEREQVERLKAFKADRDAAARRAPPGGDPRGRTRDREPAAGAPPGAQGPLLDRRGLRRDARRVRRLPADVLMLAFATSAQLPDTVSFYNVVIFIHICAAMIAFGVTFAYPVVDAMLRRPGNLRHLGWWLEVRATIGSKLITYSAVVLLLAGIYLASAGPFSFSSTFVSIGFAIVIVLLGLGGAFLTPQERRAAELAKRDIAAAGDGEITLSPEYQAVIARLNAAGAFAWLLVLAAIFVMVMKPA